MKPIFLMIFGLVISFAALAQRDTIPDSTGYRAIEKSKQLYPKFHREFQYIIVNDPLIKKIRFVKQQGVGPAFASPKGIITINVDYILTPRANFDDNRLIVVLYHEVGHLYYYITTKQADWNPENSEKAAFEYSLLKTKELAEKGDCLPLQSGLNFMKLRSEGNNLKDPHVRALKRMVNEPLYAGYLRYSASICK